MLQIESFKKQVKQLSKEHKDVLFKVRCTNYVDKKSYFVKNGVFALSEVFNTAYAFANNKVSFSTLKNEGIYLCTEIKETAKNRRLYNM